MSGLCQEDPRALAWICWDWIQQGEKKKSTLFFFSVCNGFNWFQLLGCEAGVGGGLMIGFGKTRLGKLVK